jgi:hypothetical protein
MSKVTSLQIYDEPIRIAKRIYKISDKYVIKFISLKPESAKEDIFYEIQVARISHSMGIPIAEPIVCDYAKVDGEIKVGFIMEYVDGIEGRQVTNDRILATSDKNLQLGNQLSDVEIKKAKKLGITIVEPQWILIDDKKIKFIDVAKWQYRGLEYPFD